jgi:hypothetical protein
MISLTLLQQYQPRSGHLENEIVLRAAAAALFSSPTAPGVLYSEYFEPEKLTDNTIAFILANVRA